MKSKKTQAKNLCDIRANLINSNSTTVYYYHITYAFQSESTLYSCLNVKELLTRNRRDI